MRAATLFSGIGAPEVAALWADWRWSADIDDFANAVRAVHWPDVPNLGDVNAIEFGSLPASHADIDLLVFGSPCQSFSVAGKRLGMDDARGNMALVALGVVARLRPRWFVFENVPGLFSSFSGSEQAEGAVRDGLKPSAEAEEDRDFAAFLSAVRDCGYSGVWRVHDAQYFGVPQRRRRIFFVGCAGDDWRPSAAVLLERESLRGDSPPCRKARQGVAAPVTAGAGIGRGVEIGPSGGAFIARDTLIVEKGVPGAWPAEIAPTLNAHFGDKMGLEDQHALNGAGLFVPQETIAFSCKDSGADAGPVSPTLRSMTHDASHMNGGGQVAIAFNANEDPDSWEDRTGPLSAASPQPQAVAIQERAVSANPSSGPDGAGVSEDVAFTMEARTTPQAVAFKPSHFTRDKDGAPAAIYPPLSADADRGDQEAVIAMNLRGREGGAMPEADHLVSLRAAEGGSSRSYVAQSQSVEPSAPRARDVGASNASGRESPSLRGEYCVRRITPLEAERLQGFPDGFTNIPWRGRNDAPDTRRYKALGNSMAVPVMRWILDRLRVVDATWEWPR